MQVQKISNLQYQQNFNAKFIRNNALRNLKASISHSENTVLEKQIKLIEKVNDNKVFGYETYPKDSLGNSSRIFEIIKHKGNAYKCTKKLQHLKTIFNSFLIHCIKNIVLNFLVIST